MGERRALIACELLQDQFVWLSLEGQGSELSVGQSLMGKSELPVTCKCFLLVCLCECIHQSVTAAWAPRRRRLKTRRLLFESQLLLSSHSELWAQIVNKASQTSFILILYDPENNSLTSQNKKSPPSASPPGSFTLHQEDLKWHTTNKPSHTHLLPAKWNISHPAGALLQRHAVNVRSGRTYTSSENLHRLLSFHSVCSGLRI